MPLASMSNATSICGTPRGAGGMPSRRNTPSCLLSRANSRSPCSTLISTCVWPSAAVEKIWLFLVGMVVLRSMILVITPPIVSTPSESGVTSSSSRPWTSPPRTPACSAAPMATHSSGLMPLNGSLPESFFTVSCTAGIREEPPTIRILLMSLKLSSASERACLTEPTVLSTRSAVSSSNFARLRVMSRCFGPFASAVMNGRLICVLVMLESSIFAFSAASFRRCMAILSPERSMPFAFLNSEIIQSITRLSKSSPPRWLLPAVARTSCTPSPISMMETSNVPPPRS